MLSFKEYLLESPASDAAHQLGLKHLGFGRYGRHGIASHVSKFGYLRLLSKVKPLETLKGGQLKHLEHIEDNVFEHGIEGTRNILDHIHAIQHGDNRVKISQKFDGSPSVVLGQHPQTKKFFVASKSAFNKDPKINYTEEDIDKNHGHAPGLAAKLKDVLRHGHKLGIKGVVQGDLLYGEGDKSDDGSKITFKPNTIRYGISKDSDVGKKIAKSKIGIAIHTEYDKNGQAVLNPNIKVKDTDDVYNVPVDVSAKHVEFDHGKLNFHTANIGRIMHQISNKDWNAVSDQKAVEHVKTYINKKVRVGQSDYNVPELIRHIHEQGNKNIDSVKSEKAKTNKKQERNDLIAHIRNNASSFKKAFAIQHHVAEAKHHIINTLNKNQTFEHTYDSDNGSEQAEPEGYVSIGHHGPVKLVNRQGFSKANFTLSQNRK